MLATVLPQQQPDSSEDVAQVRVTEAEADMRGAYHTDAAITPVARLDWNYQLTERWDLRFLANYRQLPDEISASPLINDNKVITVFIGGVYHF